MPATYFICEELTRRVFDNIGGFFEGYFEKKTWSNKAGDIYEESRAQYTEGRWSGWPAPSLQGPFFEWFMKYQDPERFQNNSRDGTIYGDQSSAE